MLVGAERREVEGRFRILGRLWAEDGLPKTEYSIKIEYSIPYNKNRIFNSL